MTSRQRSWYQDCLTKFASGSSWDALKGLTWCAASLGIDPEQVVEDARAVGKGYRAERIRHGIQTAREKGAGDGRTRTGYHHASKTPQPNNRERGTVRRYIAAGEAVGIADITELSPVKPMDTAEDAVAFFGALWEPTSYLCLHTKGGYHALLGVNVKTAADWIAALRHGDALPGDVVKVNPIDPARVEAMDGTRGVGADDLAPNAPYLLLEFDNLPVEKQIAFWVGFLHLCPFAPSLVSLVLSGGHSVHGLLNLRLDRATREERVRLFKSWFCSDESDSFKVVRSDGREEETFPYQADYGTPFSTVTGSRIPGTLRADNGKLQRLLFLNIEAAARP